MNAVVSQTLRCLMSDVSDLTKWTEHLPTVEMVVNSLPNRSTGYSPFYLMYGHHPVLPIELLRGDESTNVETVSKFLMRTQEVWCRDVRGKEREKTGTGKKLERTRFFPFPFLQILTSANLYCQL